MARCMASYIGYSIDYHSLPTSYTSFIIQVCKYRSIDIQCCVSYSSYTTNWTWCTAVVDYSSRRPT